jgi:hypothetical protein
MVPCRPHESGPDLPPSADQVLAPEGVSQFLENTQIRVAWDSTTLSALKKCPRYYHLRYVEGWTNESGIHLFWGNEFHKALEEFDIALATGVSYNDVCANVLASLLARIHSWNPNPRTKSEELKSKEFLVRSVIWYFDHYRDDPAKTLILADGKPAVELNFNFELDFGPYSTRKYPITQEELDRVGGDANRPLQTQPYSLCGYLDRVVEFSGDLFVMDHKTTTTTPGSYYFDRYDLDTQMSLYTLASRVLLQSPIRGVIVDVAQIAVGFTRFVRGWTYRTDEQLTEWLEHSKVWMDQAESYAISDFWPMNESSCDKYGGCEFRGICSRSPGVRQRFLEAEFKKDKLWDPTKPR